MAIATKVYKDGIKVSFDAGDYSFVDIRLTLVGIGVELFVFRLFDV